MTAPLCKKIPYMLLLGLLITTNNTFAQETTNEKPIVSFLSNGETAEESLCSSSILELSATNEFIVKQSVPMDYFAINSAVVNSSNEINVDPKSSSISSNNSVHALHVNCKYDFSETFIDSLLFFDLDVIKERII